MADSPEQGPKPQRRRASPLRLAIRVGTLIFVGGLLGLLVNRLIQTSRGPGLVAAVRANKTPSAPDFRHPVIWKQGKTWPAALQPLTQKPRLRLRDLRGYPVVLNFWASWCIPCRREAPRLAGSAHEHRGQVAFLGVDVKDFTGEARRFLRRYRVNYVSVHAGDPSIYDDYGLTGLPETYYVDARGRIVGHTIGEASRRQLEAGVARARGAGK